MIILPILLLPLNSGNACKSELNTCILLIYLIQNLTKYFSIVVATSCNFLVSSVNERHQPVFLREIILYFGNSFIGVIIIYHFIIRKYGANLRIMFSNKRCSAGGN